MRMAIGFRVPMPSTIMAKFVDHGKYEPIASSVYGNPGESPNQLFATPPRIRHSEAVDDRIVDEDARRAQPNLASQSVCALTSLRVVSHSQSPVPPISTLAAKKPVSCYPAHDSFVRQLYLSQDAPCVSPPPACYIRLFLPPQAHRTFRGRAPHRAHALQHPGRSVLHQVHLHRRGPPPPPPSTARSCNGPVVYAVARCAAIGLTPPSLPMSH